MVERIRSFTVTATLIVDGEIATDPKYRYMFPLMCELDRFGANYTVTLHPFFNANLQDKYGPVFSSYQYVFQLSISNTSLMDRDHIHGWLSASDPMGYPLGMTEPFVMLVRKPLDSIPSSIVHCWRGLNISRIETTKGPIPRYVPVSVALSLVSWDE